MNGNQKNILHKIIFLICITNFNKKYFYYIYEYNKVNQMIFILTNQYEINDFKLYISHKQVYCRNILNFNKQSLLVNDVKNKSKTINFLLTNI